MQSRHLETGPVCALRARIPVLAGLLLLTSLPTDAPAANHHRESTLFHQVRAQTRLLASRPWQSDKPDLPPFLAHLNYDQYRNVRFRPAQSLWRRDRLPFEVQFFSRGHIFRDRVTIHQIARGKDPVVAFKPGMFDFGRLPVPETVPSDLGFAGFRLHYRLNTRHYLDEVIAFLGASYFRAVGRHEVYGLSARGLALDTAMSQGEEFPVFRTFWLVKPRHHVHEMTVYALLDSPSVAGAYRFVIRPGTDTRIRTSAYLYFRKAVAKLGVAPLTSMFYFGKTTRHYVDDFRPEVHDSDGVQIVNGNGEHLWRPLNNPQRLSLSDFHINHPRLFGLMQRERNFADYQDLEANYQRRPSAWVEPVGDWGSGTVELVEIPSNAEYNDNIVLYWIPANPVQAGDTRHYEYTLRFGPGPGDAPPGGKVIATRVGAGRHSDAGQRRYVIDFGSRTLAHLPAGTKAHADITTSTGTLGKPLVERNPHTRGYRVSFDFTPGDAAVAELRCTLHTGRKLQSETWTGQWRREQP